MRVLDRNCRPTVEFNPQNTDHRKWYKQFVDSGSWAKCPVQFAADDQFISLPVQLNTTMVEYYSNLDRKLK